MNKILIFVGIILGFIRYDLSAQEKWSLKEVPNLGFRTEFPGEPQETAQNLNTDVGAVTMFVFQYDATNIPNSENLVYMINVTDYPDSSVNSDKADILPGFYKGAIEGANKNVQGQIESENDIHLGEYPGKEFKISLQQGLATIHSRMFLVKNRLYLILVICETKNDNNITMTRFFNAFELMNIKKNIN